MHHLFQLKVTIKLVAKLKRSQGEGEKDEDGRWGWGDRMMSNGEESGHDS